jgi:cytochrome c biogenesis protein CcdA
LLFKELKMENWIKSLMDSGQPGVLTLFAVFFLGMTAVFTCVCNYALFAVVAGYSGSLSGEEKSKTALPGGLAFLAGAVLSMAFMGALFGYAGRLMGEASGSWWKITTGIICVVFGLWSMDFLPFKIPSLKIGKGKPKPGILPAILFGLTVGGISTAFNSCCNPVFPVILAASFIKGSMVWGFLMLTVFALGYAMPLALGFTGIRWGLGMLSTTLGKFSKVIPYVGGAILLIMGFYFLLTI